MGVAKTLVRGQRVRVRQNGKEKYDETSFLMKLERIAKYDNGRRLSPLKMYSKAAQLNN